MWEAQEPWGCPGGKGREKRGGRGGGPRGALNPDGLRLPHVVCACGPGVWLPWALVSGSFQAPPSLLVPVRPASPVASWLAVRVGPRACLRSVRPWGRRGE